MKNSILWGTLVTLLCSQVQAETTQPIIIPPTQTTTSTPASSGGQPTFSAPTSLPTQPINPPPTSTITINPGNTTTSTPASSGGQPTFSAPTPLPTQPVNPPPMPTTNSPTSMNQTMPVPVQTNPTAQITAPINCDYQIDAKVKTIDPSLVQNWAEKATVQAFTFDPDNINGQMGQLQHCFTDQGWTGFNAALKKSGNMEAIQSHKLNVSALIDGPVQMNDVKDNLWKLTLPVQVVYQNEKEKVTQLLTVQLTVGRKMTGDLGITQMIAAPRTQEDASPANTTNTPPTTATPDNSNTTPPAATPAVTP